ncbi:MAG TPA: hypothetical protein VFI37_05440 [Gaiellaceae bacterium]|jgi:hypothetical protein|nr:hypothetical protein [Gaiellaceae bacterium]
MAQITLRVDEQLAREVKAHAGALGRSVNGWIVAVLRAAVDPDLSDSETERTRSRLARAGLLARPAPAEGRTPPDPQRLARARSAAGRGTSMSDLVSDGRA